MATKKTENTIPPHKLELYEKLVALVPGMERKGVTMPYTSHNGNMLTYLDADGTLALRLGKEERDIFIEKHNAQLMVSHGIVMKEYVAVPDELCKNTRAMKKYLQMSYEYAKTLKPKPTKR